MSTRGRGSGTGRGGWNPMENAFNDGSFNSYTEGPGIGHQPAANRKNFGERPQSFSLFVGNLEKNVTQEGLENIFTVCGGVKPISVYKKEVTDGPKTFGFVEFSNHSDAENAIRGVHNKPPHNLTVKYKQTKEEKMRADEERGRQGLAPASYSDRPRQQPSFMESSGSGTDKINGARQAGFGRRGGRNPGPGDTLNVACETTHDGFYNASSASDYEDVDRSVMEVVERDTGNNFSIRAGTDGRKVSYGRGYHGPSVSNSSPRPQQSNSSPRPQQSNSSPRPQQSNSSPRPLVNGSPRPQSNGSPHQTNSMSYETPERGLQRDAGLRSTSHTPTTMQSSADIVVPVPVCQKCMQPAEYLCVFCKLARYCSKGCADEHWPAHKFLCIITAPPPGICVADENVDNFKVEQMRANTPNSTPPVRSNNSVTNRLSSNDVIHSQNVPGVVVSPSTVKNLNQRFTPAPNRNNNTADTSVRSPMTVSTARAEVTSPATMAEWEKTEELPPNVFSKVVVTTSHVNWLWVQYDANFMKLNRLVQGLKKAGGLLAPCDPISGQVYAGNYDGEWHRVKVLTVKPTLRVLYIDFGNEEEVPCVEDLRVLPAEFTNVRAQAISIKLMDASPQTYGRYPGDTVMYVKPVAGLGGFVEVRGDAEAKQANSPATHSSPAAVNNARTAQAPVKQVGAHKIQELPSVGFTKVIALSSLEPTNASKEFWVNVSAVTEKLEDELKKLSDIGPNLERCNAVAGDIVAAEYMEGGWYRGKVVSLLPIKVMFIDFGNVETLKPEQVKVLPEEYASMPAQAIRVKFMEGSTKTRVNEDEMLMIRPVGKSLDGCIVIEQEVKTAEVSIPFTANDDLPCNRYIELPSNTFTEVAVRVTGSTDFYVNIFANGRQIDEQMCKMITDKRSFVACEPAMNALVAASLEGGKLYRAKVVELKPLKVFCIDFGITNSILPAKMRMLPIEFTVMPAQAIKISLRPGTPSQHTNLPIDARLHVKPFDKLSNGTTIVDVQTTEIPDMDLNVRAFSRGAISSAPTLETVTLPLNKATSVTVSMPGETDYWVQISSNLDATTDLIRIMHRESDTFPTVSVPKPGDLLAAKCEGVWYRMKALEVMASTVVGLFVDYGFKDTVELKNIRGLPQQHTTLLAQAIHIKLQDGSPKKYNNLAEDAVIIVTPVETTSSGLVIVKVEEDEIKVLHPCDESVVLSSDDFTEVYFAVKENSELWIQQTVPRGLAMVVKSFNSNSQNLVRCEAKVADMVALIFDGDWSRAKVTATQPKIEVQFIDFGNKVNTTAEEIRALPADMLDIPAQAIKIKLAENTPNTIEALPLYETTFFVKPISKAPDGSIIVQARH